MRIMVTGCHGQLGSDVVTELAQRHLEHQGVDVADCDLTDRDAVQRLLQCVSPGALIHCAAYTAVDKAETERARCFAINVNATQYLADYCAQQQIPMMYISTDYVFNGTGTHDWEVTDEAGPINYYGETKYLGECAVRTALTNYFIVRASWVFGQHGQNFVKTMLRLARTRSELNVVDDQIGSPTYTADLARLLVEMIVSEQYGTYHATNAGECSWCEFAREIMRISGNDVTVNPIPSAAYSTPATRPFNSRLSKQSLLRAGFQTLPDWHEALSRYFESLPVSIDA